MRRSTLLMVLVVALCGVGGCFTKTYKEEREDWGQKQWREAIVENQERMKSEDQRKKTAVLGVFNKVVTTVGDTINNIYNYLTGKTPFNAALAMLDPSNPDKRREGIVYLSKRDYGRQKPYIEYYAEMAKQDDDNTVRAMAVRALNRSRDKAESAMYIQSLEDPNYLVRLEAAKALANMPDPAAIPALIKHLEGKVEVRVRGQAELQDEDVDVRIACADALRNHRTAEAAQALVRALRDRQFGIAWVARKSLKLMTGKDYRYDQAAWLTYLSGSENPLG